MNPALRKANRIARLRAEMAALDEIVIAKLDEANAASKEALEAQIKRNDLHRKLIDLL